MKAGQIVAQGDPAQIITEQTVRDVFGLDCCIIRDPIADTPVCIPIGRPRVSKHKSGELPTHDNLYEIVGE